MMFRLWILHVSNVFNLERCLKNMLISVSIKHKSTYVFCFFFCWLMNEVNIKLVPNLPELVWFKMFQLSKDHFIFIYRFTFTQD